MIRRILPLFLLAGAAAFSGCASMNSLAADSPSVASVEVPKTTPAQAYDAGVLLLERGDYAAARREWDRCLAMAAPDSPVKVDCMVALEKTTDPSALEP